MALYLDTFTELLALFFVFCIAAPAIVLLCCVLDECPMKTKTSFEEQPFFCGATPQDTLGNGPATLCCFFFVIFAMFGFASFAGGQYMMWRGEVQMGGANVYDYSPFSLLQGAFHHHPHP